MAEGSKGFGGNSWLHSTTFLIWRANTVVHNRLKDALENLGVSVSQWGIMEHIDEFGALSAADISRGIHLTPQSINTALGVIERAGLIVRQPHPDHGRIVMWALTPTGREVVAEGRRRVAVVRKEVEGILSEVGLEPIVTGLTTLVETLDGPQQAFTPRWTRSPDDTGK